MLIFEAIVLGIVQGLTEFIPVSSSGHLIIFDRVFDLEVSSLTFDVSLHFGTLLSLLIYFRRDLAALAKGLFSQENRVAKTTIFNVVFATIPAMAFGLVLHDLAETTFRSLLVVVFSLALFGLLFLYVDTLKGKKRYQTMPRRDALSIGLAQVLAFVPGVSRSGVTMTAGRLLGYSNESAARFSFLMAIPVIAGATLATLPDVIAGGEISISIFVVGIATSFLVGYLAIRFMLNYLSRHGLRVFGLYRIALASVLLVVGLILQY